MTKKEMKMKIGEMVEKHPKPFLLLGIKLFSQKHGKNFAPKNYGNSLRKWVRNPLLKRQVVNVILEKCRDPEFILEFMASNYYLIRIFK
jgi:hypothetical protein